MASFAYTMEDAADKFPKDIAAMEQNLKRLEETGAETFFAAHATLLSSYSGDFLQNGKAAGSEQLRNLNRKSYN